jgi:hypothetical protein
MKRVPILLLGLLAVAAAPLPGQAEWGWPPPGYSTTGVRACDGSQYRGLCARLRDRRHGVQPGCIVENPAPCDGGACGLPPAPASAPAAPQAPAPEGAPRR